MKKPSIRHPARALVLVGGLFAAQVALAQVSTGAFSGKFAATDKVVLRNVDTGFQREVKVKDDGSFWVRRIPVGTYEITVTHADGTQTRLHAAATIGITTRVN